MMKIYILFLFCFFVSVRGFDTRIAGGGDGNISDYPFLAALLTNQGNGPYLQKCGGSILTNNAILSAASCFYTNGVVNDFTWWRARVGSNNANSGGVIYIINRITIHDNFNPTSLVNDIAVVRTNLLIAFQPNLIQPGRIAGAAYPYADRLQVYAVGWGVTSHGSDVEPSQRLQVAEVWVVNQQTCTSRHSAVGFTVTDSMVCAGYLDVGERGQCEGDVGGPLLDASGAVIGVFSHAQDCANPLYPDINTRVSSFTTWIIEAARATNAN